MSIQKKSKQTNNINEIVSVLFEIAGLGRIPRSGLIQYCYEDFETIADHSHKVAYIAYFLAVMLNADIEKVLTMAIFHDVTETRVGDSNLPQKKYTIRNEQLAVKDQYSGLPAKLKSKLLAEIEEYEERKSLESKIVKDADYLAFYIVLKQLEFKGNKEAKIRLDLIRKKIDFLFLDESKKLLVAILKADPNDWSRAILSEIMKKRTFKYNAV
jgi:putative hydrolase of HD superfamily